MKSAITWIVLSAIAIWAKWEIPKGYPSLNKNTEIKELFVQDHRDTIKPDTSQISLSDRKLTPIVNALTNGIRKANIWLIEDIVEWLQEENNTIEKLHGSIDENTFRSICDLIITEVWTKAGLQKSFSDGSSRHTYVVTAENNLAISISSKRKNEYSIYVNLTKYPETKLHISLWKRSDKISILGVGRSWTDIQPTDVKKFEDMYFDIQMELATEE